MYLLNLCIYWLCTPETSSISSGFSGVHLYREIKYLSIYLQVLVCQPNMKSCWAMSVRTSSCCTTRCLSWVTSPCCSGPQTCPTRSLMRRWCWLMCPICVCDFLTSARRPAPLESYRWPGDVTISINNDDKGGWEQSHAGFTFRLIGYWGKNNKSLQLTSELHAALPLQFCNL